MASITKFNFVTFLSICADVYERLQNMVGYIMPITNSGSTLKDGDMVYAV